MEVVSLGAPFLLDAAKKADKAFCVSTPAGRDTTREACKDVTKMTSYLKEKLATKTDPPLHL